MDIIVRTTNHEMIASGSVIVPHGEYAEFIIRNLVFRMSFISNGGNEGTVQWSVQTDENTHSSYMSVECINFENSVIRTLRQKLRLAQIDGKPLLFQFSVSSINKRPESEGSENTIEDKLIWYSWYLEKPNNNSQPVVNNPG